MGWQLRWRALGAVGMTITMVFAVPAVAAPVSAAAPLCLPTGGSISTVAGSTQGFSGDAAMADMARLVSPQHIALLPDGGYLIADPGQARNGEPFGSRVRRVSASGAISTVAGTGTAGYSGDGGPATAAMLNGPSSVAALPNGGFLVVDSGNHRVRKVSATGIISTVAGTGIQGSEPTGDGGPATEATFYGPSGVEATADGGFLIVDGAVSRIRKVSAAGIITTVAGTWDGFGGDGGPATSAQLKFPVEVEMLADGGFLIADERNNRIRRVSASGTISTVAGGGSDVGDGPMPASSVALNSPRGVAVQPDGGFLIAETNTRKVRRVSPAGVISTVAGTGQVGWSDDGGPAINAGLRTPVDVAALPDGGFLIADTGFPGHPGDAEGRVRRVSATGIITTDAGRGRSGVGDGGDGVHPTQARLDSPTGVTVLNDGGFLIADTNNHRLRRVTADGNRISTVAGDKSDVSRFGDGEYAFNADLHFPSATTFRPDGSYLIADSGHNNVRQVIANPFEPFIITVAGVNTQIRGDGGVPTADEVDTPRGVASLPNGDFLIADTNNHRVRRVSGFEHHSTITTVAGNVLPGSGGDGGPATSAQLFFPSAIAVLPDGGHLIADAGNGRIRKVAANGTISTVAGSSPGFSGDGGPATGARLNNPRGVTVLPDGEFLVADTGNNRIRKVTADGTITTIAGNGSPGTSGDGCPATSAQLNAPTAVALLADGGFLIADTGNHRIRRVTPMTEADARD